MEVHDFYDLYTAVERTSIDLQKLHAKIEWEFLRRQVIALVESEYDLGEVTDVWQIHGGYINLSFGIVSRKDGVQSKHFVRKYNEANTEIEIRFEHALLNHLDAHGFHVSAHVVPTKNGGTYVSMPESPDPDSPRRFWAVYQFLEGEDKYTWVDNKLNDREYDSAGRVLAHLHAAAHDFDPGDLRREQPPIMDFVPTLPKTFEECARKAGRTAFDRLFLERFDDIMGVIERALDQPGLESTPYIPVHCDYHPGNQKYENDKVVGLFDFDWSKVDYRLFDVALAVAYFCSSWVGDENGILWVPQVGIFLRAYQDEAARHQAPGPMDERELANFPKMLACANLFLLNWDITAYYGAKNPDVNEYLKYLRHNIRLMDFIEENAAEIAEAVASAAAPQGRGGRT